MMNLIEQLNNTSMKEALENYTQNDLKYHLNESDGSVSLRVTVNVLGSLMHEVPATVSIQESSSRNYNVSIKAGKCNLHFDNVSEKGLGDCVATLIKHVYEGKN